jgi:ATP-dependent Lon protease
VGPPGVGKTSLAKSIARALGRKFVRFSLGGVRDEAEIRGHRKTYVGAMPGKIIQSMKKAGTVNPVILLDEVDKMSMDFRGDPSAALLEVLDPEQNVAFNDHYLEIDYDLSNVMFITTANVQYDIPLPLQDRMEIIHLNSYLDIDKIEIAKRHIIPKLLQEFGLKNTNIEFTGDALDRIINGYTREAGVRNLEREIGSVLRKLAKEVVEEYDKKRRIDGKSATKVRKSLKDNAAFTKSFQKKSFTIDAQKVESYLKAPRFRHRKDELEDKTGVATGLAWTSMGGEILPVEVTIMPGAEKLTLTGKLGDVMKESAQAALSYVRSNYEALDVPEKFNQKKEIHIHVPEGAIPKDGPSAGITMTMALISAASGRKLRGDTAMTGEVNLRGEVLPIGGLNEKLLAAKRAGIICVLIPKDNERDIEDMKEEIKKGLKIITVRTILEALPYAFRVEKKGKKKV